MKHETHISTEQDQAQEDSRVPRSHGYAGWTPHSQESPSQGSSQARSLKFSKSSRLLKSRQFRAVALARNSWKGEILSINYRFSSWPAPKLGLTVPKKVLSKAHERNQFKRVVREAFRLSEFPRGLQMSISPIRGTVDHTFVQAEGDFKKFLVALRDVKTPDSQV